MYCINFSSFPFYLPSWFCTIVDMEVTKYVREMIKSQWQQVRNNGSNVMNMSHVNRKRIKGKNVRAFSQTKSCSKNGHNGQRGRHTALLLELWDLELRCSPAVLML